MKIIAKCPVCKSTYYLGEEWADKRYRCGICMHLIKIPSHAQLQNALDILKNAPGDVCVDEDGNIYG